MQREIPKLQVLCLRGIGSQACSAEETFASNQQTGDPSMSSQLLRAFHKRKAVLTPDETDQLPPKRDNNKSDDSLYDITAIPLCRTPCVGPGASRRANANDVDLNHPLIAHHVTRDSDVLVMEHGTPALDCLQSYIDSLVELGRMDDGRLGIHFFDEWKANVLVAAGKPVPKKKKATPKAAADDEAVAVVDGDNDELVEAAESERPRKRSRRRTSATGSTATTASSSSTKKLSIRVKPTAVGAPPPPLGSLSLNNCAIADDTFEAMRESGVGIHLGVLDLTGIYTLTDGMLEQLLPHCPHLTRFSIKNCRRLTVVTLKTLAQYQTKLQFLDIGGTYNITPDEVIDTLVVGKSPKRKPAPELVELQVSGLGWNDALLGTLVGGDHDNEDEELMDEEDEPSHTNRSGPLRPWKALSLGFSISLSALGIRHALSKVSATLVSLALHFCENVVDNALMGMLGRNLPHVKYLDVRGNGSLNSMTGWYDGRASAELDTTTDDENAVAQELIVLARFTSITKASLEETLRIHPLEAANLKCILDGGGAGVGVYR